MGPAVESDDGSFFFVLVFFVRFYLPPCRWHGLCDKNLLVMCLPVSHAKTASSRRRQGVKNTQKWSSVDSGGSENPQANLSFSFPSVVL